MDGDQSIAPSLRRRDGDSGDRMAATRRRRRVRRWRRVDALVPGRGSIDAHGKIIVTKARLEDAWIVVGRHVPVAAHNVVDVLAVACGVGSGLGEIWPSASFVQQNIRKDEGTYAGTEAEFRIRHKVRPLVVLDAAPERIAIHKTANRVAVAISAMRVELSSVVAPRDVDLRQVANTGDLDIVRRLHEVHTCQRAVRDGTRAAARLRAPSDLFDVRCCQCCLATAAPRGRNHRRR